MLHCLYKLNREVNLMDNYYFKLVCVDEQNPLEYDVLEDVNLSNLEDVHKYVEDHIETHSPEHIKWMLIPMRKENIKIA